MGSPPVPGARPNLRPILHIQRDAYYKVAWRAGLWNCFVQAIGRVNDHGGYVSKSPRITQVCLGIQRLKLDSGARNPRARASVAYNDEYRASLPFGAQTWYVSSLGAVFRRR